MRNNEILFNVNDKEVAVVNAYDTTFNGLMHDTTPIMYPTITMWRGTSAKIIDICTDNGDDMATIIKSIQEK